MKKDYLVALGITITVISLGTLGLSIHKCESIKKDMKSLDSLETEIQKRDSIIEIMEEESEYMQEEIQIRESEISYWGQKYDSLSTK